MTDVFVSSGSGYAKYDPSTFDLVLRVHLPFTRDEHRSRDLFDRMIHAVSEGDYSDIGMRLRQTSHQEGRSRRILGWTSLTHDLVVSFDCSEALPDLERKGKVASAVERILRGCGDFSTSACWGESRKTDADVERSRLSALRKALTDAEEKFDVMCAASGEDASRFENTATKVKYEENEGSTGGTHATVDVTWFSKDAVMSVVPTMMGT